MSIYLDPKAKQAQKVTQDQTCLKCKKGLHHLCTRRKFLGMSSNGPVRDCCCGGQPSQTIKFQGSGKVRGSLSSNLEDAIKKWAETEARFKKNEKPESPT